MNIFNQLAEKGAKLSFQPVSTQQPRVYIDLPPCDCDDNDETPLEAMIRRAESDFAEGRGVKLTLEQLRELTHETVA